MVEFETIDSRDIKFGNNNFIEVSVKKAVTDEGENSFFSLSRGFFTPVNEKRYKKNFAIPNDGKTIDQVLDALTELVENAPEPSAGHSDEE